MSDKNINDADMGVGGIDRFNSETGKSEIIRPSEMGDKPFTIDDYNAQLQAAQDKREQGENIMSEETQQVDTGEPVPENPGGIEIAFRPKTAVNIMRCQFPNEITTEINQHIEDTIIPNNVDHSEGLVGQIRQNKEKSAQLTFPHEGDEVGEMFGSVLERLAKEFVNRSMGEETECKTSIESMWTVHSYSGDYNPIHDHGTKTPMGVSCIMYLQVPRCIQTLGNPAEEFEGLNESSGAVDGFTYLTWGQNGMRDINMMRPITEEYVKPEIGTLIMFPSWLRHGVMPFFGKEDDERRTFSANINVTLGE
jgi:hypothetical protein|tara:strand:+ start:1844 stop:2767 length:924 start_codon:yes stop_codon:yes gene_type:complete